MEIDREIFLAILVLVSLIILFFSPFKPNLNVSNFLVKNRNITSFKNLKYFNCKDSSLGDDVDNLSEIFTGIIYGKTIAVCISKSNKAYCLGGIKEVYANYPIIYFEACILQKNFDPDNYEKIIVVNYTFYNLYIKKNLKNTTKIVNYLIKGAKEGYIYGLSHDIIKALLGKNI